MLLDLTVDKVTPMRLAVIGRFPPSRPGASRSIAALADALHNLGHSAVDVFRLVGPGDHPALSRQVVMEVDPSCAFSAQLAAARANEYDAVMVHFEPTFDTATIYDLVDRISKPTVLVLHDLPDDLGAPFQRLLERSTSVVAPSRAASDKIGLVFSATPPTIIRPGSSWFPARIHAGIRRKILTWGLMAPGMGVENAIRSLPYLADIDPPVEYHVVGPIHPDLAGKPDARYRDWLQTLATDLGVIDQTRFDPLLYPEPTLRARVADADLIVIPYDATERTASRLLTEALALGRPVVATRFPYAVEMLSEGAGITVEAGDPDGLANAIRLLLFDDGRYRDAVTAAGRLSTQLHWNRVAFQFEAVVSAAIASTREPA